MTVINLRVDTVHRSSIKRFVSCSLGALGKLRLEWSTDKGMHQYLVASTGAMG
jgi:hypothetical protein